MLVNSLGNRKTGDFSRTQFYDDAYSTKQQMTSVTVQWLFAFWLSSYLSHPDFNPMSSHVGCVECKVALV
jgi:hypothetical protein